MKRWVKPEESNEVLVDEELVDEDLFRERLKMLIEDMFKPGIPSSEGEKNVKEAMEEIEEYFKDDPYKVLNMSLRETWPDRGDITIFKIGQILIEDVRKFIKTVRRTMGFQVTARTIGSIEINLKFNGLTEGGRRNEVL